MGMLAACSQVGHMRRMMKKQMPYMQHWTRGWMKGAKKEGYLKKSFVLPELYGRSTTFRLIMECSIV